MCLEMNKCHISVSTSYYSNMDRDVEGIKKVKRLQYKVIDGNWKVKVKKSFETRMSLDFAMIPH